MQEDNVYVNGSQHLMAEPQEQAEERLKEEHAVLNELPILKQIDGYLETEIARYDSVRNIPEDIRLDERKNAIRCDSNAETATNLIAIREYITSVAGEHMVKP